MEKALGRESGGVGEVAPEGAEANLQGAPTEADENEGLWPGDSGTLGMESRRALLQLVRGPMITSEANRELWQALLDDRPLIASRLADLFLELVVKEEDGIAFAQNAPASDTRIPKAVRNQPLTLIDTVLVLTLRRELMISQEGRVFVGREETFASVAQYRPLAKLDEAAFRKRLEGSWSKLTNAGILMKAEGDERYEISPVLRLIFGPDEVKAVNDAFDDMLAQAGLSAQTGEPGIVGEGWPDVRDGAAVQASGGAGEGVVLRDFDGDDLENGFRENDAAGLYDGEDDGEEEPW